MEHSQIEADKPAAKAKPKPTSNPLPSCSMEQISNHERKWIDMEPSQEHMSKDAQSYPVSKRMKSLLRRGTIPREEDGASEFWRLKKDFKPVFPNSVHWALGMWIDHLSKKQENKRRDSSSVRNILDQKFFTFELSKVIREKSLWNHLYWTTC